MNYRRTESPRGPAHLRGAPQSLNIVASAASWKVRAEGQEETVLRSLLGLNGNFKQEWEACVELSYHSFIDWGTELWSDFDLSSFECPSIFLFLNITFSGMWLSWGWISLCLLVRGWWCISHLRMNCFWSVLCVSSVALSFESRKHIEPDSSLLVNAPCS